MDEIEKASFRNTPQVRWPLRDKLPPAAVSPCLEARARFTIEVDFFFYFYVFFSMIHVKFLYIQILIRKWWRSWKWGRRGAYAHDWSSSHLIKLWIA